MTFSVIVENVYKKILLTIFEKYRVNTYPLRSNMKKRHSRARS